MRVVPAGPKPLFYAIGFRSAEALAELKIVVRLW